MRYSDWPVPWIPSQLREPNQAYWSGYYSSRPVTKGYAPAAAALIRAVGLLDARASEDHRFQHAVEQFRQAAALFQHHDAITGTERQIVADDYSTRLNVTADDVLHYARPVVFELLGGRDTVVTRSCAGGHCGTWRQFTLQTPQTPADMLWTSIHVCGVLAVQLAECDGAGGCHFVDRDFDVFPAPRMRGESGWEHLRPPMFGGDAAYELAIGTARLPSFSLVAGRMLLSDEDECPHLLPGAHSKGSSGAGLLLDGRGSVTPVLYNSSTNASQPSGAYIFRPDGEAQAACLRWDSATTFSGRVVEVHRSECAGGGMTATVVHSGGSPPVIQLIVGPLASGTEIAVRVCPEAACPTGGAAYGDANGLMRRDFIQDHPTGDAVNDAGVWIASQMHPVSIGAMVGVPASMLV